MRGEKVMLFTIVCPFLNTTAVNAVAAGPCVRLLQRDDTWKGKGRKQRNRVQEDTPTFTWSDRKKGSDRKQLVAKVGQRARRYSSCYTTRIQCNLFCICIYLKHLYTRKVLRFLYALCLEFNIGWNYSLNSAFCFFPRCICMIFYLHHF